MSFKENSVILYTLFANFLNKFKPVWFDKIQSCLNLPYWKYFRSSEIFIFRDVFIGLKSGLQVELSWD